MQFSLSLSLSLPSFMSVRRHLLSSQREPVVGAVSVRQVGTKRIDHVLMVGMNAQREVLPDLNENVQSLIYEQLTRPYKLPADISSAANVLILQTTLRGEESVTCYYVRSACYMLHATCTASICAIVHCKQCTVNQKMRDANNLRGATRRHTQTTRRRAGLHCFLVPVT